jgi:uncharacterized membrane protein
MQRLLFAALYLLGDLAYVMTSRPFYDKVVVSIQGKPFVNKPFGMLVAALTYLLMGVGWLVLVAPVAEDGMNKLTDVVMRAALVGLLMYGVFNGTLYVFFEKWTASTAIRDMAWGVTWITVLSVAYALYATR